MTERPAALEAALTPVFADLIERSMVTDSHLDRDVYRLSIATLWCNLVMDPPGSGITEADLEPVHDLINAECENQLGPGQGLLTAFEWIASKAGEQATSSQRLVPEHADMLRYFASMMLDPDGHRRWMDTIRSEQESGNAP